MDMKLLDELLSKNDYVNAYIVVKNIFCRNISDSDAFYKYADLGLKLASFDFDIDERKNYLNEVSNSLVVFSENVVISQEILERINEYQKRIHDVYEAISISEKDYIESYKRTFEDENTEYLTELGDLNSQISNVVKQSELDEILNNVNVIDSKLNKEYFTDDQQETYTKLTSHFSNSISSKMEDINRNSLVEINKEAIKKFKNAFETFKDKKNAYKESESNLKSLLVTTLFAYDTRDLLNESLIYYNHVYAMIFNEVSDNLKFKMTEWSINSDRINRKSL